MKREKEIKIRLSQDEYQCLLERKTKPRLAEWVREIALDQKPKRKAKPTDPKLLFELNRAGVNLNQIAKHCNQSKDNINLISVGLSLRNIEQLLREIKNDS